MDPQSCLSQAGSFSESEFDQDRFPFAHGQYQIERLIDESWEGDVRRLGFVGDYPRWEIFRGEPRWNPIDKTTDGRLRNQFHLKQRVALPTISETFPLPVSAIAALRTGTISSIDSDDSDCSTPEINALVENAGRNRNSVVAYAPELDPDQDEDEDVFDNLNAAIIGVLAPDFRFASGVIAHLYKLPAHLRSFVYGFASHGDRDGGYGPLHGFGGESSTFLPQESLVGQGSLKRKTGATGDEQEAENDVQEQKKSRTKRYSRAIVDALKYACPFNIYDPRKYCVHNEQGSTGGYYSSCMGPGWTEPRHLKEHILSTHRIAQCPRCWQKFDDPRDLDYHRNKMEPRCEDRIALVHEKESITETEWTRIEAALATPRLKKGKQVSRRSDWDRWFDVWRIILPQEVYPAVPTPSHPYYVDPNMLSQPLPTYSETEQMIEIFKAMWNEKIKDAKGDDKYYFSQEEVCGMIRETASITAQAGNVVGTAIQPPEAQNKPIPQDTIYGNSNTADPVQESGQPRQASRFHEYLAPSRIWPIAQDATSVTPYGAIGSEQLPGYGQRCGDTHVNDNLESGGLDTFTNTNEANLDIDWSAFDESNAEHLGWLKDL